MGDRVSEAILTRVKSNSAPTVDVLLKDISRNLGVRVSDVAKCLHQLSSDEKIKLENPNPPRTLVAYAKSMHSFGFWTVIGTTILTSIFIYILPQSLPYMYLRYGLGSLFVLFLPGHALIEALYPEKNKISSLERLVLSIGLSLVLVTLLGLILNYTPWGIRLDPILLTLSIVTVSLASLALTRKFSRFKPVEKTLEAKELRRRISHDAT